MILLTLNPSQTMSQMPKYLMKEGARTGLSTTPSINTILPMEHQQLPQSIRLLLRGAPQAANAKDVPYHFSFNLKQQMALLRPSIPNCPTKKAKRKFVSSYTNQLGMVGKLLPPHLQQ